ncbi:MAG: hypothetical protein K9J12_18835 [Melioribacteraceae bacterium]|nr:hypothetical protein [Melioribacteraceae bacterium]MCF8265114.1 hypothetical protein [Melioribacteraceae bacterium]MCF8413587.1 hypothetical protein [Melioribacteraceae bacterium]MCF8431546.1 hypothetical protein [Melioribacteraceae bacterium]
MKKLTALFLILFLFSSIKAQTLEETLGVLSGDAGTAYIGPLGSGFGSNMNSGWFKGVPEATIFSFDVRINITASATMFSDENKTFSASGNFHFSNAQAHEILTNSGINSSHPAYNSTKNALLNQQFSVGIAGPTILGSKEENVVVNFPAQTVNGQSLLGVEIETPAIGFLGDLSLFPTPMIQGDIGTIYGTSASFRFFPEIDAGDIGKVGLFGFGIMHNPGMWFPNPLPIDLGVGFFTQTLKAGDVFESKSTQMGIFASKQFGAIISITPYFGLTTESSTTTVKYDYTYDTPVGSVTTPLEFELEGENGIGITVGADIQLVFLNIFVDYKMATYNTASAGISFGF